MCIRDSHVAITGIMGVDKDKIYSLCGQLGSRFMIEEWGYPDIGDVYKRQLVYYLIFKLKCLVLLVGITWSHIHKFYPKEGKRIK